MQQSLFGSRHIYSHKYIADMHVVVCLPICVVMSMVWLSEKQTENRRTEGEREEERERGKREGEEERA